MDPKLLAQLREVIEQGSMSRAALTLKVTQPTLTRNMKAIEEAVGAPVLQRGRYGVTPTNLGERLSEQGQVINNAMFRASEAVQHWRTGFVGEVRLGIGVMLSVSLMPEFLSAYPVKESDFTLRVESGDTNHLMAKLRKTEIDMAILPTYSTANMEATVQHRLFKDQLCVVAGANSPLVRLSETINAQQLAAQSWISINNIVQFGNFHDNISQSLGIERIVPKLRFVGDVTAPMAVLRNSDLLALLPRQFAQEYVSIGGVHILDTEMELPIRDVALWITKASANDRSVIKMSNLLQNLFKQN